MKKNHIIYQQAKGEILDISLGFNPYCNSCKERFGFRNTFAALQAIETWQNGHELIPISTWEECDCCGKTPQGQKQQLYIAHGVDENDDLVCFFCARNVKIKYNHAEIRDIRYPVSDRKWCFRR